MRLRLLLLSTLVLLLGGCQLRYALFGLPAPRYELAGALPAELPYRESGGLMLVEVAVDGQRADFVLDTGAPVTVLMNVPRLAALQLDTSQARKLGPADNPAVPVGVIRGGFDVGVGPVALRELTAVVIDPASLPCRDRFDRVGMHGVIGADLFRHTVVEVDPARRRLRLHDPARWQPPAGAVSLPLQFAAGMPFTEIGLQHGATPVALRMLVDTGANDTVSLIAGSRPELAIPAGAEARESCYVAGTRTTWRGAPVDIALGTAATRVAPSYEDGDSVLRGQRHGSIGLGLLKRYAFAIDYPGKRIVLLRALD